MRPQSKIQNPKSRIASLSRRSAFTLIEMLTVITIIGILAGLIVGASKYAITKSKRGSTLARMTTIETALEDYKADNGAYPKSVSNSGSLYAALSGTAPGGGKRYFNFTAVEIAKAKIFDSFGNEYQYVCPGVQNAVTFDLWSAGPDGKTIVPFTTANPNTADDITNWQTN